jgi:hypothetical protein
MPICIILYLDGSVASLASVCVEAAAFTYVSGVPALPDLLYIIIMWSNAFLGNQNPKTSEQWRLRSRSEFELVCNFQRTVSASMTLKSPCNNLNTAAEIMIFLLSHDQAAADFPTVHLIIESHANSTSLR